MTALGAVTLSSVFGVSRNLTATEPAPAAGDAESKQRMGVLQTQLSDSDRATANKSAATFHAAPLNRSANVPPEAADLG